MMRDWNQGTAVGTKSSVALIALQPLLLADVEEKTLRLGDLTLGIRPRV